MKVKNYKNLGERRNIGKINIKEKLERKKKRLKAWRLKITKNMFKRTFFPTLIRSLITLYYK